MSKDKEKEEYGATSDMEDKSPIQKSVIKNHAYYVASSDEFGQIITQVQLKDNDVG